jgi:signal transduction histidine kinase
MKFTEKGSVTVSTSFVNGAVQVSVADTGAGIPIQDQDRIFDKFHQIRESDTLEHQPRGTGLGLPICKHIIDHYGGSIEVDSTPGQGSRFTFSLPAKTK